MLRKLLVLLATAAVASAQLKTTNLNTKKGNLLYSASYTNTAALRTTGAIFGNYTDPSGAQTAFGGNVGINTLYSFVVKDKKTGANKPWKNLFAISSSTFAAALTNNYVGTKAILAETYQVTSLDSNGALLGSLNWAGTYAAATVSGTTTTAAGEQNLFPVEGATGVYKGAKAVKIVFGDAGVRAVSIYKSSF